MKSIKIILLFILSGITFRCYSQIKPVEVRPPDSIKVICDKLFIAEMGKKLFHSCIKYEKSYGFKKIFPDKQQRIDYFIDYVFSFPVAKEVTVKVSFIYAVYSGKGHLQSAAFLRENKTDLPSNFKKNGIKIMNYKMAFENAIKEDTVLRYHKDKVQSRLILTQDAFYWCFSYGYPQSTPIGDAEMFDEHRVFIDPYTGKTKLNQQQ
jgi:hypothetical protein